MKNSLTPESAEAPLEDWPVAKGFIAAVPLSVLLWGFIFAAACDLHAIRTWIR